MNNNDEYQSLVVNDAFANLRTSQSTTLFDGKMTYEVPVLCDQVTENGATITHIPELSGAEMAVTAAAGSRAVLQQAQYTLYQPGNSHEPIITYGDLQNLAANSEFRVGYFDDENGPFIAFKDQGSSMEIVLRSSSSGSVSDDLRAFKGSWNIDNLDGKGPSGKKLSEVGRQIIYMDIEWLSIGAVLVCLVIDRQRLPIHMFKNANKLGDAYMTTADLPLRWELIGNGEASSLVAQCGSVKSYGANELATGYPFGYRSPWVATSTTPVLLFAVRPKDQFFAKDNHTLFSFIDVDLLAGTESMVVDVIYNPTIATPSWVDVDAASDVQSAMQVTTAGTVSGGTRIKTFGAASSSGGQGRGGSAGGLASKLPFTRHADGSLDILAFVAYVADGAGSGNGSLGLNWEELR